MLTHSFEDLAQAFRVLLESNWQFRQLLSVDYAEAIGTLETAINAKLNAFHNLYDLMRQNRITPPNWYEVPELCVILAIRNARHHNKANRIRSMYNYHRYTSIKPSLGRRYVYVDFPAPPEEEGGDCFDVPLSWYDLDTFLSLPQNESRLRPKSADDIREYLNSDYFEGYSRGHRLDKERIFFNLVPLTLNAGIALQKYLKPHVNADSVEASHFLKHFEIVCPAMTRNPDCRVVKFSLPK